MTPSADDRIVDEAVYHRSVERLKERRVLLPTFKQLADPHSIPASVRSALEGVKPDEADPLNLFRAHWYNAGDRSALSPVPEHVVLPPELTGVEARIVVMFGDRFPIIGAHKVLASYACLAPRLITGQFDPSSQKAIWPSTGNYCRGGVAISRLMSCRGVAVLPEGMSRERFEWLEQWVADPSDVIRTPGTESNVKEIYDECAALAKDASNVIFNQFAEFGNHLVHYACTGRAAGHVFEDMCAKEPALRLCAFVSATGSAGTIAAGDFLKETYGARIVAVEALECPTMLYNGFGEHNIQGIGDKHVPLIHNVYNTDVVTAVSDRATDQLGVLFSAPDGLEYLARRGVKSEVLSSLSSFGLSSICNVLAAIKTAKYFELGRDDVIVTVATDGASMYGSERERVTARDFPEGFEAAEAAEVFGEWMLGAGTDHLLETSAEDRARIFNLGYFTWVEQQGIPIEDFLARREQSFWIELRSRLPVWDEMIRAFNSATGVEVG